MAVVSEVNADGREFWTGAGGDRWLEHGERWDTMLAAFGAATLDAAGLRPGERILDIGCGLGQTTVDAAERVAPDGSVLGVDISPELLASARERVEGLDNVSLLEADAQAHAFEPASYDAVISRFGVMFFDDPPAAFANFRRALKPGGRLAFVCWQEPLKTGWIAAAIGAAVPIVGCPPDLGEPGAPGPFAFADADRTRRLVEAGGFGNVSVEPLIRPQRIADDPDDAVRFVLSQPQSEQWLDGVAGDVRAKAAEAAVEAFGQYNTSQGVVTDAAAWLVTAGEIAGS